MKQYFKIHNVVKAKKDEVVNNYDLRSDFKQVMTLKDYDSKLFKTFLA